MSARRYVCIGGNPFNPDGGTHKRRSKPMNYEEFIAKESAFWVALYD